MKDQITSTRRGFFLAALMTMSSAKEVLVNGSSDGVPFEDIVGLAGGDSGDNPWPECFPHF